MHIPVLVKTVADLLVTDPAGIYVDATVGAGGHAAEILSRLSSAGRLVAFDLDPKAISYAQKNLLPRYQKQVAFVCASFHSLLTELKRFNISRIDGVLFDLGLSSLQIDDPTRGFSFRFEAPLDMRFDERQDLRAADLVNSLSQKDLARIFREYGEESRSEFFAKRICEARQKRKIETTFELLEALGLPKKGRWKLHPATKVFMALRIAVNRELVNLEEVLPQVLEILKGGGRLAVISFHSLEDRIVKQFFRAEAQNNRLKLLTKKVIKPPWAEIQQNPRARSAKLRVAEKIESSF